jgi:hypothetical protein
MASNLQRLTNSVMAVCCSGGHRRMQQGECELPKKCSPTCAKQFLPWLKNCRLTLQASGLKVDEEFGAFKQQCAGGTVTACSSKPCGAHGKCQSTFGRWSCICDSGWSGKTCNSNPCFPSPCGGHGRCSVSYGRAKCYCTSGWTGSTCRTAPPRKCPNNCRDMFGRTRGTCNRRTGQCACHRGYGGSPSSIVYKGHAIYRKNFGHNGNARTGCMYQCCSVCPSQPGYCVSTNPASRNPFDSRGPYCSFPDTRGRRCGFTFAKSLYCNLDC